jgi:hypothetical protein
LHQLPFSLVVAEGARLVDGVDVILEIVEVAVRVL